MTSSAKDVQLISCWASPYAWRVQIALSFKAIPFTLLPENVPQKSSLLLQSNPIHQKVPVLLHLGKPICESLVILEYVDDAFPSPHGKDLLPKDPHDRALARFWADFCDTKVFNALRTTLRQVGDAQKAAIEQIKEHFKILDGVLDEASPYFGGADVGFVDIVLAPLIPWLPVCQRLLGFDLELHQLPRVSAWMKAFSESSFAECFPAHEKLLEYAQIIRKRFVPDEEYPM